ncbi:ABC transporter permease [Brevibacterium paucivorans]
MSDTAKKTKEAPETRKRRQLGPVAITGLVSVIIALMLLAFLTPAIHSGAHDIPLAVSAPEPAKAALTQKIEASGAFKVVDASGPEDAVEKVKNRETVGAVSASPTGTEVTIASGAGAPYAATLKGIASQMEAGGQEVTVNDVAPMTEQDPQGVGLASALLPLIFGGMASSVLLATQLKSASKRTLGAVGVAVLGGLAAAAILQPWFNAVAGSFWLLWAGLSLGILAISSTVLGLFSVMGFGGVGIGAILMLFVSNPLSGFTAGPHWLPAGWGALGQWMPVGAAGTFLRSAAYFDGRGLGASPWVLVAWIVAGLFLIAIGARRQKD